jgi:hypothetical protein
MNVVSMLKKGGQVINFFNLEKIAERSTGVLGEYWSRHEEA